MSITELDDAFNTTLLDVYAATVPDGSVEKVPVIVPVLDIIIRPPSGML